MMVWGGFSAADPGNLVKVKIIVAKYTGIPGNI